MKLTKEEYYFNAWRNQKRYVEYLKDVLRKGSKRGLKRLKDQLKERDDRLVARVADLKDRLFTKSKAYDIQKEKKDILKHENQSLRMGLIDGSEVTYNQFLGMAAENKGLRAGAISLRTKILKLESEKAGLFKTLSEK